MYGDRYIVLTINIIVIDWRACLPLIDFLVLQACLHRSHACLIDRARANKQIAILGVWKSTGTDSWWTFWTKGWTKRNGKHGLCHQNSIEVNRRGWDHHFSLWHSNGSPSQEPRWGWCATVPIDHWLDHPESATRWFMGWWSLLHDQRQDHEHPSMCCGIEDLEHPCRQMRER